RSEKAIQLETGMQAKFEELLAGIHKDIGPLKFKAHVRDLDLASIPMVCERGKGVISAEVDATDLFYKLAEIKLSASGRRVQWDDSPPVELSANAHAEDDHLRVGAKIGSGAGALQIDGRLPVGFQAKDPALIVNHSGPVALTTRFQHIDAASLLAFVPGVKRVSGALDGEIDVSGTLQNPDAKGSLSLDDVSFTLPRLGQRFSHLNMKALLANRKLRIEDGNVRDLTGTASFSAQLSLTSADAWNADVNLKARGFPVRKSGVMMGRADLDAKVQAKSTKDNTDVSVALSNVSIVLTTSDIASVQSLEPNPDIVFADAHEEPKAQQDKEAVEQAQVPQTHATINVETTEPLWIRRDDFAVQMTTKLKVVLGGSTPDMTGVIQLMRGYISLLGQSFDIKTGRVVMTGGTNIDPQLEITATHSTPGGTVVRLEVTGFVTHPELAFYVNDQSVTAGEALTAITGRDDASSGSDSGAQQAIASAAMGMTTGLLSLGARREFGDWIPMLSVEQGDQTRVRVGFEADRLVPKFMRGFVRGAYVEGIVASGDSSNGRSTDSATPVSATANTASGGGVLLELLLPKDFVWAGQYGPGVVWSVDLDWRP
ncbi:MAG TPA: translocation/assembly module TamB domain-containing protein, partial [Polyangiales bacterium]|nr:translocation/assembly module TamB domain-containing protein [Polyangiales bacterium]